MKQRSNFNNHYFTHIILFTILLFSGCTHMFEQPIHEINSEPIDSKINLSVGLFLSDDFRNAKYERESMGDTWIIPIGENLTHHSVQLMERVFDQSVILEEDLNNIKNTKAKYVMAPELLFFDWAFGVSAFSESKISLGVEWKLTDISGKVVWVETVNGVGTGKQGNMFTGDDHMEINVKRALQDLFNNSQDAMLSSRLLRILK